MIHTRKTCCFIGHRNATLDSIESSKLYNIIENLILNEVTTFIFGSKSNFDTLCYKIVTKLKIRYNKIERIIYTCKNETALIENNCEQKNSILKKLDGAFYFEKIYQQDANYVYRKNSYIERNKKMIKDSDFCIFYLDKKYSPIKEQIANKINMSYHANSGTAIAYSYAKKLNKSIINIFELLHK